MKFKRSTALIALLTMLLLPAWAARHKKDAPQPWPELLLDGGRKLTYQNTFSSQRDIRGKTGLWTKLTEAVIGEPDYKQMARPYGIAVDSRGRLIVTDPGVNGIHIFDPAQHRYKFIERQEKSKDAMFQPQCVAVDAKDNIYVTDSESGKVFVFEPNGKLRRVLGSLKGGEGFFKRPTGIAIDPDTQNIYVSDTLRDQIFVMDPNGQVLRTIGKRGIGQGEFRLPTHLLFQNGSLVVVDALNFRVQFLDRDGTFRGMIGSAADPNNGIYRPKGIAIDSEGHIYLAESEWGSVQVFDRDGNLLYTFGNGTGFGQFHLPAGLFIDRADHVFVVDSYNHRVQMFQYHAPGPVAGGSR